MHVNPWHIKLACRTVRQGGVIAYPTEAVFGLGCVPFHANAVRRILRLKRRSAKKGLILVAADVLQLDSLVDFEGVPDPGRILDSWPGPVTWILPARPGVPPLLTGGKPGLAVRVSAHPIVVGLCRRVGPVVSTSANPSGAAPARSPQRVRAYFGDDLDYILPGSLGGGQSPSEIFDAVSGRVVRASP